MGRCHGCFQVTERAGVCHTKQYPSTPITEPAQNVPLGQEAIRRGRWLRRRRCLKPTRSFIAPRMNDPKPPPLNRLMNSNTPMITPCTPRIITITVGTVKVPRVIRENFVTMVQKKLLYGSMGLLESRFAGCLRWAQLPLAADVSFRFANSCNTTRSISNKRRHGQN